MVLFSHLLDLHWVVFAVKQERQQLFRWDAIYYPYYFITITTISSPSPHQPNEKNDGWIFRALCFAALLPVCVCA